ncbi:Fungal Zn2-Cys6 binuclear cluster domain-containing protein [Cladophialophora immunda]|nr:Fungal Zn2-Cys6 binuclear cluster domain-containing protein [Cladophialophora immunda]
MAGSTGRGLAPFPDADRSIAQHDQLSSTVELPPRKKVSLACLACRRRRTKCDGGITCDSCLSRNTECVRDENDDGRRKLAVKRRIETLEKDRHLLEDLLNALRLAGPNQLNALVTMIRAEAGRHEIKTFLEDGFRDFGAVDEQNRQQEYRRHRHMLGRVQDIMNPPLQLPAKPWTTVTDDDDLISHLMSLWFTWAHPWWHWVDEKQFIKAMQAGDTSSLICTPYLVNMMLADACLLDTLGEDGEEPNLELRQQFYNEGKKGLDAEEGRISLAYLAALGVQWTYLDTNGQDQLGNATLYQQVFLVKSLGKWRTKVAKDPKMTAQHLDAIDLSIVRLEWTLYCLGLFVGLALEQVRLFDKPTRARPVGHPETGNTCDENAEWKPYPLSHTPVDWHPNCHYLAYIALAEVITEDEALYEEYRKSDPPKMAYKFQRLFTKVKAWPESIPPCMRNQDSCMPHVIALHALHSWVIITMGKQTAALEGSTDRPSLVSTPPSFERDRWKHVCRTEAVRISEYLERMRQNWGADHFPVMIIQPATVAAFALLEDLDRPDCQGAFYKLCIVLRAASRRFRVCKSVLRLLEKTANEINVVVPGGCAELLADEDYSNIMELDGVMRIDDLGLDYLLEKWDDLDLDEAS